MTRYVDFAATLDAYGSTSGQMTFAVPTEPQEQNVDGVEEEIGSKSARAPGQFYFRAAFDCMVVDGTRAVMSGSVTESSNDKYIGQRVLLVVQDKGDDSKSTSTDKLTWGLYDPKPRVWLASDAEVEDDKGVGITWLAVDAERDDDVGQPSDKNPFIGCQSFPLSSFSLMKVKNGDGDIEVRP